MQSTVIFRSLFRIMRSNFTCSNCGSAWPSACFDYATSFCLRPYSKYAGREARFMTKLLSKGQSRKKFRLFDHPSKDLDMGFTVDKVKKPPNKKRIAVLNKIFMEYITELLVTGNLEADILRKGVQITSVEIAPDFHNINVFWVSPPSEQDLESTLNTVAFQLRHELSQLKVIGTVPKITFVKDSRHEKIDQVEKLMAQISHMNISDPDTSEIVENNENFPRMINSVYGLDQDRIMKKLGFKSSASNEIFKEVKNERDPSEDDLRNKELKMSPDKTYS